MVKSIDWFESWFDSAYYHVLYQNRDDTEAKFFLDNITNQLPIFLNHGIKVLDLACGKGRHARYLSSKGFDVTGVDLSQESIIHASQYTNDKLRFEVHDMRAVYKEDHFDIILNLFTSFGYFNSEEENQLVVNAMYENLKQHGFVVIDFFNAVLTLDQLVKQETKILNDISFNIIRHYNEGKIIKAIEFTDRGKKFKFEEKVQALNLYDFERYLSQAGFRVKHTFGDYNLNQYDEKQSPRLIIVAEK